MSTVTASPLPSIPLRRWLSAYLPAIGWAVVIFTFSAQQDLPGLETSFYDFIFKKAAHMAVYGLLFLLLFRAARLTSHPHQTTRHWLLPLTLCFLYAISDEYHQSLTPGRYPSVRDIGYDMLGASIVWLRLYKRI